jgi:Fe(3+) dicitrate transport protein
MYTHNFGTADPTRSGVALNKFSNTVTAFIPGISAEFAATDSLTLIGGVHEGFSPPAPPNNALTAANAKSEKSTNYELGARYTHGATRVDVVGFFNDYSNLLGADTSSGGGGGTGDQFNGGSVHIYGVEASLASNLGAFWQADTALAAYRFPLRVAYTYTKAQFQNSFNSSFGEWGNVTKGDDLPYIPQHQVYASIGVEAEKWLATLGARYVDKMRTRAGSGAFLSEESTDSSITVDAYGEYRVHDNVRVFSQGQNLFDDRSIVARRPAGARPNAPRIVFAGVKVDF